MRTPSIIGIIAIICAIWVIHDVWTRQPGMSGTKKILWTVFALIFSIITAIVYYFSKKR